MHHSFVCLLLCAVFPFSIWLNSPANAQARKTAEQKNSAEFARLLERWRKTADPDEEIVILEEALKLEGQLKEWSKELPTKGSRQRIKGSLQAALGASYQRSRKGNRADNLEKAIAAYERALTVFTREALPREWAQAQHELGNAYVNRIDGDPSANFEKAIAAHEAALAVRTRQDLPREWAESQHDLALAYRNRVRGDHAENLEKAIAAYEAALTVRTREAMPREWVADSEQSRQRRRSSDTR